MSQSSTVTFDALNATQTVSATVTNKSGTAVTAPVSWQSDAPTVASVTSAGTTTTLTAVANGTAHIKAVSNTIASAALTVVVNQQVAQLSRVSGNAQSAAVNTALPAPLVVLAADRNNNPVAAQSIAFTASGGTIGTAAATTGSNGQASTTWSLPTAANTYTATAALSGAPAVSTSFTAIATPGAAQRLTKVDGDGQRGSVAAVLANAIIVGVADQFGNAVSGAPVVLAVTAGGGALSVVTATTSATGQVSAQWTMGNDETLAQTASIVSSGLQGSPAVFSATALRASMGGMGPTPFKGGCHLSASVTGIALSDASHISATFDGVASPSVTMSAIGGGTFNLVVTAPSLSRANQTQAVVIVKFYSQAVTQNLTYDTAANCT